MLNNILYHARKTEVPENFMSELKIYLDYVEKNPDVKEALEEYYKLLYDGEAIFPILKVQDLPLCEKSEKAYPGFFSTVIFLKAAEHFEKYLHENGFDKLSYDFMDTYYKNIRRFMEMNHVRDNTYALVRLGYCLYGYSKPFVLRIGRLAYELRQFDATVFNVFKDECGKMVFIKNPETEINDIGYPMTEGHTTDYKEGLCFDGEGNVSQSIRNCENLTPVICPGDYFVTIHIPGEGKLDLEEVQKSISDSREILKIVFKDYKPKLYMCTSWLLSPQLKRILKEGSNILKFADLFESVMGLPSPNPLYEHIFKVPVCDVSELKPKNAFQEGILQIYKDGYELHSGIGILKSESVF